MKNKIYLNNEEKEILEMLSDKSRNEQIIILENSIDEENSDSNKKVLKSLILKLKNEK